MTTTSLYCPVTSCRRPAFASLGAVGGGPERQAARAKMRKASVSRVRAFPFRESLMPLSLYRAGGDAGDNELLEDQCQYERRDHGENAARRQEDRRRVDVGHELGYHDWHRFRVHACG